MSVAPDVVVDVGRDAGALGLDASLRARSASRPASRTPEPAAREAARAPDDGPEREEPAREPDPRTSPTTSAPRRRARRGRSAPTPRRGWPRRGGCSGREGRWCTSPRAASPPLPSRGRTRRAGSGSARMGRAARSRAANSKAEEVVVWGEADLAGGGFDGPLGIVHPESGEGERRGLRARSTWSGSNTTTCLGVAKARRPSGRARPA